MLNYVYYSSNHLFPPHHYIHVKFTKIRILISLGMTKKDQTKNKEWPGRSTLHNNTSFLISVSVLDD